MYLLQLQKRLESVFHILDDCKMTIVKGSSGVYVARFYVKKIENEGLKAELDALGAVWNTEANCYLLCIGFDEG